MHDWMVNIRKIDSDKWCSGVLTEQQKDELVEIPPHLEGEELAVQEESKKAQKYSDNELDTGEQMNGAMAFDLHEYIDVILEEGEYEIYVSTFGLESNRVTVKITFKETE